MGKPDETIVVLSEPMSHNSAALALYRGHIGIMKIKWNLLHSMLLIYWDNGKENGNYIISLSSPVFISSSKFFFVCLSIVGNNTPQP